MSRSFLSVKWSKIWLSKVWPKELQVWNCNMLARQGGFGGRPETKVSSIMSLENGSAFGCGRLQHALTNTLFHNETTPSSFVACLTRKNRFLCLEAWFRTVGKCFDSCIWAYQNTRGESAHIQVWSMKSWSLVLPGCTLLRPILWSDHNRRASGPALPRCRASHLCRGVDTHKGNVTKFNFCEC